ncbi:MAG: hypothetical protein ACK42G_06955 [Candidatus Kapaibacteriota bacterium]
MIGNTLDNDQLNPQFVIKILLLLTKLFSYYLLHQLLFRLCSGQSISYYEFEKLGKVTSKLWEDEVISFTNGPVNPFKYGTPMRKYIAGHSFVASQAPRNRVEEDA